MGYKILKPVIKFGDRIFVTVSSRKPKRVTFQVIASFDKPVNFSREVGSSNYMDNDVIMKEINIFMNHLFYTGKLPDPKKNINIK